MQKGDTNQSPLEYFTEDSFIGEATVDLTEQVTEGSEENKPILNEGEETEVETPAVEVGSEEQDQPDSGEAEEVIEADAATRAYFFAKEFVDDGTLPEDFEFDENLTGQQLKEALINESTKNLDVEGYAASKGYTDEVFKIASAIASGTPPEMAYEINRYNYISQIDLDEDDSPSKQILLEYYKDRGFDPEEAEGFATAKVEDGLEVSEAKKAQQYFAQKASDMSEKEESRKVEAASKLKETKDNIIGKIKSRKVSGLELTKKEASDLVDYLYKPTEVEEVVVDGKKQRKMVSKFKKDYDAHTRDPEAFIKFAYNMQKGFDLNKIKRESVIEAASRQIDALNARTSKIKKTENKKDSATDLFAGFTILK